jgi:hypothetical protein
MLSLKKLLVLLWAGGSTGLGPASERPLFYDGSGLPPQGTAIAAGWFWGCGLGGGGLVQAGLEEVDRAVEVGAGEGRSRARNPSA